MLAKYNRFNVGLKGGTVMAKNEYYIWHPVEEFPQSQYEINKMGQVRNTKSGQILNGSINKDGYLAYVLTVEGKVYRRFAHIMVAKQFLPNPDGLPVVNHIDENKSNPCVDNLEWTTYAQNLNHGEAQNRSESRRSKPISEYSLSGKYIRTWKSAKAIYMYFGLDYDRTHRTTYLVKILTNNDDPEAEKIPFANRIFMRYTGNISDIHFIIKSRQSLRNEQYINLPEPEDVPEEFLFDGAKFEENSVDILNNMFKRYALTIDEAIALRYAIRCIENN